MDYIERLEAKERETKKNEMLKLLNYFTCVKEFVEIYANINYGEGITVNNDAMARFITSDRFLVYGFDLGSSKEDIFKALETEIYNDYPIWELLEINDFVRGFLEKDLEKQVKETKSKYDCYSCSYYKAHETSFGIVEKCNRPIERFRVRRESFELINKGECEYFSKKY